MSNFKATVARNSNGSIELAPAAGGNVPGKIEPGSEVEVTIDVTRTPAQIEEDANASKKERGAPIPRKAPTAPAAEGDLAGADDQKTIGHNVRKTTGR